jgi:hypothetical protein
VQRRVLLDPRRRWYFRRDGKADLALREERPNGFLDALPPLARGLQFLPISDDYAFKESADPPLLLVSRIIAADFLF